MTQIFLPINLGLPDIAALATFIAAAEQNHDFVTVFAKVDTVARAKEKTQFVHTTAHWLAIAKISAFQTSEPLENTPPRAGIAQTVQPAGKRFIASRVVINDYSFDGIGHRQALISNVCKL